MRPIVVPLFFRFGMLLGALCSLTPVYVQAQAVNYIDESGTVHFADSLQQVPMRYRTQIVTKRPEVTNQDEYREAQRDYKKRRLELEREKHKEEKAAEKKAKIKAKEDAKRRKLAEREEKKHPHQFAPTPAALDLVPAPTAVPIFPASPTAVNVKPSSAEPAKLYPEKDDFRSHQNPTGRGQ